MVACDKVSVAAGGEIPGHVYIQLNKSTRESTALYLVFSGKEEVQWHPGSLRTTKGKNAIKKDKKIIMTWEYGLQKGQYDIPFAYLLPDSLYSSFSVQEEKFSASVSYSLSAVIISKGRKMKNTVKIEIMNQSAIARVPLRILKNYNISRSCMKDSFFEVKGQLSNNIYFSNENVEFELSYDNTRSALNIDAVKVSLVRVITLKTESSEATQFSNVIDKARFNRVASGSAQSAPFKGTLKLRPKDNNHTPCRSIATNLIVCKYLLVVKHVIAGCCVRPIKNLEAEVEISPDKAFLEIPVIESPDGWNPQSFPVARVSYLEFQASAPILEEEEEAEL